MAKRCQVHAAQRVVIAARCSLRSRGRARIGARAIVAAAMLASSLPSAAVSRLGQATDDSVCDIGATERGGLKAPPAAEFVATKCRNGQVLIGSSPVPQLRYSVPLARVLATKYCAAEDIKSRYMFRHAYTVTVTDEHVRCILSKLPQPQAAGDPASAPASAPPSSEAATADAPR